MRAVLIGTIAILPAFLLCAGEPAPGSDAWLTNASSLPEPHRGIPIDTNRFAKLKCEAVAGKLLVRWETAEIVSEARIIASADAPGHWPARDWRTFAMHRDGTGWVTEVPADTVDVPLIYCAVARDPRGLIASPLRIIHPRAFGLEEPTRLFWPFIEGFEQGLESWRTLESPPVRRDAQAKNGRASLAVRVAEDRRSATLVTTRLRGWFLEEHNATGITLWLRTKQGTGNVHFALFANAFSTNQVISRRVETMNVTERWTRALLPFNSFPKLTLADVDLFAVELTARPGTEFLIDDVQLLGRWPRDF